MNKRLAAIVRWIFYFVLGLYIPLGLLIITGLSLYLSCAP